MLATAMPQVLPGRDTYRPRDAAVAVLAALLVVSLHAIAGFSTLADSRGDNDSLLRLVEVRDLIAGQGWFDLHQYRMGPADAMPMHWSRLVDAPLAAIVLLVAALAGSQAAGETVAMVLWPPALLAVALFLLLRIGRRLAGDEIAFPLLMIGGVSLYYTGMFAPAVLDHHNVQLVLTLGLVLCLLAGTPRSGWGAGLVAVAMLAVGMETLPFVAVAGIIVALWLLLGGDEARRLALGFGVAFALASAAVFFGTVPAGDWGAVRCDAFSVAHFGIGLLAGAGLAALAAAPALNLTFGRRALSLAALAALAAGAILVLAPQCLADPYAGLAPALRLHWLDFVGEAQPLWNVIAREPESAAGHYLTVLLALGVYAIHVRRNGLHRRDVLFGAFLLTAFLVSVWQIRGSRFSVPLACVPLAIWVAGWRSRAQSAPGAGNTLRMLGAWIVSFNVTWILLGASVPLLLQPAKLEAEAERESCEKAEDYGRLAAMPAQGVLVISNLGAPVLRHTPHRVLAGPYHRNVDGNLAALDAFTGPIDRAAAVAKQNGMMILAFCRGNGETRLLARQAPEGLLADLLAGNVPSWLEILPETRDLPLQLYRIHGED